MVTDFFLGLILSAVEAVVGLLPEGQPLDIPAIDSMVSWIQDLNSVIPVGPVIQAAVALLSLLGVFLAVRLVLTVWNLIWP